MGLETTHRTRQLLLAVRDRAVEKLDKSIEDNKDKNPFLNGVEAIQDALISSKIECRIYDKEKFHAKAYITHAEKEVIGSQALVGSSNFTAPGLSENIELNNGVSELQKSFQDSAIGITKKYILMGNMVAPEVGKNVAELFANS